MKVSSAIILTGAMFALATNSIASEILERHFKFEDSGVNFQNDPTFVIENFEKEKKPARPKLVLTVKQKQEGNISESIEINTPVTQTRKIENPKILIQPNLTMRSRNVSPSQFISSSKDPC